MGEEGVHALALDALDDQSQHMQCCDFLGGFPPVSVPVLALVRVHQRLELPRTGDGTGRVNGGVLGKPNRAMSRFSDPLSN
jgi:hypothetical protein